MILAATIMLVTDTIAAADFQIHRGVNISNWLSQSSMTISDMWDYISYDEIDSLRKWGFDYVRLPIGEQTMFTSTGVKQQEAFNIIHQTIRWCENTGLRIIIDFHTMYNKNHQTGKLWDDATLQNRYIKEWQIIAKELKDYSVDSVAFELLNEPNPPKSTAWNELASKVVSAIRATQKHRKLVIGSHSWNSVKTFQYLKVPSDDKDIILTFHFYTPFALTHQGATWTTAPSKSAPLRYPGELISDKEYNKLSLNDQKAIKPYQGYYDREVLEQQILLAYNRAKELGLQVVCGEFGAYQCDSTSKINWVNDMVSILDQYEIPYSYWEYKSGFGFCNSYGKVIHRDILNALTSQKVISSNRVARYLTKQGRRRIYSLGGQFIGVLTTENYPKLPHGVYIIGNKKIVL